MLARFNRYLLWPLLLTAHLLAVSLLAWHLLAQVNFAYPLGYQWLNVEDHIQTFGPKNRFKDDFEQTTTEEHHRLFAEITEAIQENGQGLAEIQYQLPSGERRTLLRQPEQVHLRDVARLVNDFYTVGGAAAFLLFTGLAYARWQRLTTPAPRKLLVGYLAGLLGLVGLVLVIGPVKVFYWLHEYAFPEDHPWFFYYEESLMTTLMKAPDLFGLIAVFLLILATGLWALSFWGMTLWLKRRGLNGDKESVQPRER